MENRFSYAAGPVTVFIFINLLWLIFNGYYLSIGMYSRVEFAELTSDMFFWVSMGKIAYIFLNIGFWVVRFPSEGLSSMKQWKFLPGVLLSYGVLTVEIATVCLSAISIFADNRECLENVYFSRAHSIMYIEFITTLFGTIFYGVLYSQFLAFPFYMCWRGILALCSALSSALSSLSSCRFPSFRIPRWSFEDDNTEESRGEMV